MAASPAVDGSASILLSKRSYITPCPRQQIARSQSSPSTSSLMPSRRSDQSVSASQIKDNRRRRCRTRRTRGE
eukprot:4755121-Prymnesium_polylepis.2